MGDACRHVPAQHRAQAAACSLERDPGSGGAGGGAPILCGGTGGAGGTACTGQNAACCHYVAPGFSENYCNADDCAVDTDCGANEICVCAAGTDACSRNHCRPAGCRIDADCGAGMYCSPSRNFPVPCRSTYECHTPADECTDDVDCSGGAVGQVPYCAFDPASGHWKCQSATFADCSWLHP